MWLGWVLITIGVYYTFMHKAKNAPTDRKPWINPAPKKVGNLKASAQKDHMTSKLRVAQF